MKNVFSRPSNKNLKKRGVFTDEARLIKELNLFWERRKIMKSLVNSYNACSHPKYTKMKRLMTSLSLNESMKQALGKIKSSALSENEKTLFNSGHEAFKALCGKNHLKPIFMKDLDIAAVKNNVLKINQLYSYLSKCESRIKKMEKMTENQVDLEQRCRARDRVVSDICSSCEQFLSILLVQNSKPTLLQVLSEIIANYSSMLAAAQNIINSSLKSNNTSIMLSDEQMKSKDSIGYIISPMQQKQINKGKKVPSRSSITSFKSHQESSEQPMQSPDYFVALCDYEGDSSHISLHEGQKYPIIKSDQGSMQAISKSNKKGAIKADLVEFIERANS